MRGTSKAGRAMSWRGGAGGRGIFGYQRIGAADRCGRAENADRAKQRQQSVASGASGAVRAVQGAMDGETATTAERLREASALAAAAHGLRLRKGKRLRRGCSGNWKR